jgi:hypothetical protein
MGEKYAASGWSSSNTDWKVDEPSILHRRVSLLRWDAEREHEAHSLSPPFSTRTENRRVTLSTDEHDATDQSPVRTSENSCSAHLGE